ncbi:MAG: patatin-like phospholipase family protein [Anaerolineaceae bacterium]|jgi:NTE family protein
MGREINLALGGGGVRGIAHLGAVQCLLDHGYKINGIAGTSAGGLFGATIAAGNSTHDVATAVDIFFNETSFRTGLRSSPFSLINTSDMVKALDPFLQGKSIKDFPIPFVATAVSLRTGKEVVIREGEAMQAVLATIAIPGFFPSQGDDVLVDGGVLDPVPVDAAREFDTSLPVVAIMLHKQPSDYSLADVKVPLEDSLFEPLARSISRSPLGELMRHLTATVDIVSNQLSELRIEKSKPDVLVEPIVGHIGLLSRCETQSLVDEGYRAMEEKLEDLDKAFSIVNSFRRITKYSRSNS